MVKRILSVDGGGIRGVGAARLLSYLDSHLKAAGKPAVADLFDMYVGTSTGCIIAAGLAASGQISAPLSPAALVDLYYARGANMFVPNPSILPLDLNQAKYKSSAKADVLQQVLGELTLGQLNKNFLGTFYSMRPNPGAVFAQGGPTYRAGDNSKYDPLLLWEVVNASSDAPVYFDPSAVGGAQYVGVDGGVFANNPAVCAYVEALKMFDDEDIVLVSVGCGFKTISYPTWGSWGVLEWASPLNGLPLLDVLSDGQATTVDHQMTLLLDSDKTYFRFQFDLDGAGQARIDDVSGQNLNAIVAAVDKYVASPAGQARLAAAVAAL